MVRPEGLNKLKTFNGLNGNWTCDLPACSIVPQRTKLPRAPCLISKALKCYMMMMMMMIIVMFLQPIVVPLSFFSFSILYTVGRSRWTGDQTVARPPPTHNQDKHRINTLRHPYLQSDSNRRPFEWAKTVHTSHRAATVIDGNKVILNHWVMHPVGFYIYWK
jgi:hypothetical protein